MSKNIKILLAEDDTNLGNLLCDYLKAKGYHTVLAANGEEAFNLFAKGNYNLCLLGFENPTYSLLKRDPGNQNNYNIM